MNEKEIELTSEQKTIKTNSEKEANLIHKDIFYIIKAILVGCLIMFVGILIGFGI